MSKKEKLVKLITDNVENAFLLSSADNEVAYVSDEKEKKISKLILANKENAKALSTVYKLVAKQQKEIEKQAAELILANKEKAEQDAELAIANKELVMSKEKEKLVEELIALNKDLTREIKKRIESDYALEESNEKYSRAFQSSPYSIAITRAEDGKFIEVNEAFTRISGFTKEEIAANSSVDLNMWVDKDVQKRIKSALLDGMEISGEEVQFRKKDGEIITGLFSARVIHVKNELHIISSINDISKRKKAESELISAKEMAEESERLKSAFLTNMSHEIRTPMNGILGFTELLKEPNLTGEEQQDFIRIIQKSGERMLNTINSIVDISKIESGMMKVELRESDINEQIEFIYELFKPDVESKGIRFMFKNGLKTKESIIRTDIEKVCSILDNLVKNAIKFTDSGSIEIGYDKKGNYLEFYVKDTGIGISIEQQKIIFNRFRQGSESLNRNYEGSGLGLSIARSYVEMLGGKIWLESEVGSGTVFYFTLPYDSYFVENSINKISVAEANNEVPVKKMKILIAEDDNISYSLLKRSLKKISEDIIHAKTGVEAIELCRNNPGLDLVLMDIRMPDMDGYEATRQIREFNKDVIIIAQTAYGFSGDNENVMAAGCSDYISKPINLSLLLELIKKHMAT